MRHLRAIECAITDRNSRFVAFCVAIVVGSCLTAINQGIPFFLGETMTPGRWISAFVTPVVPFFVSLHGQGMKKSG
ncbi:MAG: nitrate/nitrite transporter NrtS [Nitrosospira sp.]|nr:nitrate/nitrite transporter NrtS [Nitrosospira sp.]MDN5935049.1 nitrate/nitrite transporter NrtS [Nitrosospira sp.]